MIKKLLKRILPSSLITKFWWGSWYLKEIIIPNIKKGKIYFNFHFKITVRHPYQLARGPLTYNEDGLATSHICGFLLDPHFVKSYKLGSETKSWGSSVVRYRAYIACWCAAHVKNYEGDFVECGVNKGGFSRTIISYINFNSLNKTFYLLDTFQGLVDNYISPEERRHGLQGGGYEECYEQVKKTFNGFRVNIIKGTVPETLNQVRSEKICYLSIDMNCIAPEIAALDFFWDKLVSGAIVLLDDYGRSPFFEHKPVYDKYLESKGKSILSLPTGQGIIIK